MTQLYCEKESSLCFSRVVLLKPQKDTSYYFYNNLKTGQFVSYFQNLTFIVC
jgi:hypothetical protein